MESTVGSISITITGKDSSNMLTMLRGWIISLRNGLVTTSRLMAIKTFGRRGGRKWIMALATHLAGHPLAHLSHCIYHIGNHFLQYSILTTVLPITQTEESQ